MKRSKRGTPPAQLDKPTASFTHAETAGRWRFTFPNPADFNFNYWNLLSGAAHSPVAVRPEGAENLRIAIVGAGVAGLTAARELFRCGYPNIDMYEATNRLGGRAYSALSPDGLTTFELGAMRLPFFWPHNESGDPTGRGRGSRNCVFDYYCGEFDILTQDFPNPGAPGFSTGIYINRGRGATPPASWQEHPPQLICSDDPILTQIRRKWDRFGTMFHGECRQRYAKPEWRDFWARVVSRYDALNFREFVRLSAHEQYDPANPGSFGGLGMTPMEARVFAVVGMGDGGWGAFYDISCLYVLRTALFGFFDGLQMVQGKFADDCSRLVFPEAPEDTFGQPIGTPHFLGVQSLTDCLFYTEATLFDNTRKSLYAAMKEARKTGDRRSGVNLYTRSSVTLLEKWELDRVREPERVRVHLMSDKVNGLYDHVVVTVLPWSLQVESGFRNFEYRTELPWAVRHALDSSHFITSCKVFYPLKERYWEEPHRLPQVIITDTFIQGVYGMAANVGKIDRGHPGVALISYTWEDDALRLVADEDSTLSQRCLEHLDWILRRCGMEPISPCLNTESPVVHHWERSRSYRGCARLYRPESQAHDSALLTYNEMYSKHSGLYLAGEAYSVEGGWIEPALRSALEAVLYLVRNTGGIFKSGFDFRADYPSHVGQVRPR